MDVLLFMDESIEQNSLIKLLKKFNMVYGANNYFNIVVKKDISLINSLSVKQDGILIILDLEFLKNILSVFADIRDFKAKNPTADIILIVTEENEVNIPASRFGISYVIKKPFNEYVLNGILLEIELRGESRGVKNKNERLNLERLASSVLTGTGILPNLKGYVYLKDAVCMGYKHREMLEVVTKYLYPEVAKRNNTTADRVERAMRNAIKKAWDKYKGNNFYEKMGLSIVKENKRPTNSEYIFAVVEYLHNNMPI